ncbi:hypothetical protein SAMN04488047_1299 [Tranquillimonas alkanivorans]|uniref:PemK-like, MazF-like toxin of type II toxin-antitoxin system n=2 Tax=Tranquillimonas alkanivorans TaxID=441119 RepID=A0A1I5VC28_9RHOB|nr:hypothetical protein SAMN04488047_1299 [Tranquillimonas alkanivorans]
MTDTAITAISLPSWARSARPGMIVRFAFPYTERRRCKVRPCLLVHVDAASGEAVVAYGTSRLWGPEPSQHAVRLDRQEEWEAAGLNEPTRFQCDRRIRVSLADRRFRSGPDGKPPLMGELPSFLVRRACQIYASLPAVPLSEEAEGIHPGPQTVKRQSRLFARPGRRDKTSKTTRSASGNARLGQSGGSKKTLTIVP